MGYETLFVNIKAVDQFTGTFQRLNAQANSAGRSMSKMGLVAAAGAAVGVALLTKGLFECVQEAMAAEANIAQTESIIRSTGGAANVTAEGVTTLAKKISDYSGFTKGAVRSAENMMLTFRAVRNEVGEGNDIFDQAIEAAADLSRKFGTDLSTAAKQLGKALNDPVAGVTALKRMGVSLDAQQKASVKTFMEQNNIMGAQKVILDEINKEVGNVAESYGKTLAGKLDILKAKFVSLKVAIGEGFLPVLTEIATKLGEGVEDVTPSLGELGQALADMASAALADSGAVEALVGALKGVTTVIKFLNETGLAKAITELNKWAEQLNMLSGGIFNLLGYLTQLQEMWAKTFGKETISREASSGVEAARDFWNQMEKESERGATVLDSSAKKAMKKITQAIVGESPVAKAQQGILMDALKDVISARGLDLQSATANDIAMMAQGISTQTGVPVEAVQNILNQMMGRVSSTTLSADPMMQSLLASINSWKGVIASAVGSIATAAVTAVSNVFSGLRLPSLGGGGGGGGQSGRGASGTGKVDALTAAWNRAMKAFGDFKNEMVSEPFKEVEEAIMGLTAQNHSSLDDWRNLRLAYDAANAALNKYTKQAETYRNAITNDKKSIEYADKLKVLQLQIMQAQDKQQWERAQLLQIEKDRIERLKEERDLSLEIKYEPKIRAAEKEAAKYQALLDKYAPQIENLARYFVSTWNDEVKRQIAAQKAADKAAKEAAKNKGGGGAAGGMYYSNAGSNVIYVNFNPTFSMASDAEMRRAAQKLKKYLAAEGVR